MMSFGMRLYCPGVGQVSIGAIFRWIRERTERRKSREYSKTVVCWSQSHRSCDLAAAGECKKLGLACAVAETETETRPSTEHEGAAASETREKGNSASLHSSRHNWTGVEHT